MSTLDDEVMMLVSAMSPANGDPRHDSTFLGDLGYTSLRFLELMIAVERAFDLQPMTPEIMTGVLTVGDLVDLVRRQQSLR